ncbi:VWA domain-containing protein [Deinococcus sp. JMULE3]|uniref:vWA domain-containing protein n=1 Tax=Deinococcus sp. JMULE3 TaxID=2518341 RepID=UPI0015776A3A|nr:VWA domain-containing protein [Deinococcus sp. JMULE3]NTY02587.1 VWA domain-containing protein [Deinococcus sp. JMULE3]
MHIELRPLIPTLTAGQDTELVIHARLTPPTQAARTQTPPRLNLALVLDRSGSMSGQPLHMARLAAQTAVRQLRPTDHVSLVTFDDTVTTVIPPQPATDPDALSALIDTVTCGGMTALHAGWLEGATLCAQHLDPAALNRVLLLSDGGANVGETNPSVISNHVRGLTALGVSTSTIGLGEHYDDHLMQAVADAGDGNFEHIENPADLPRYFEQELQGLSRTSGHTVSLGIEPNPALGSRRHELLNDLPRTDTGRAKLPNLIQDRPTDLIFTVHVPAQPEASDVGITRIRLAWTDRSGQRHVQRAQLNLPVQPAGSPEPAENPDVRLLTERLRAARAREEAVAHAAAGAPEISRERLSREVRRLHALGIQGLHGEIGALTSLDQDFAQNVQLAQKRARSQSYNTRRSK